jgi:hypothetical protein
VPVRFGGRLFWACDVSLGILLLEAIHVAVQVPPEQRPPWVEVVLEGLRTHIRVGASYAFSLDADGWDELPPAPMTDRHWFFGVHGAPRTL